jgi:hypothetical protein
MASQYIGVLRGVETKRIYAVLNLDDDRELDSPRYLLIQNEEKEPVRIIRVPRAEYMGAMSMDQVAEIVERLTAEK